MNILERIQLLCEENNITVSKLEVELGLGKGTLYKWNKNSPNSDKLSQVADYFNVSHSMLKIFSLKSTIDFSTFPAIIFSIFN